MHGQGHLSNPDVQRGDAFAKWLCDLGKYHACDIHQWTDEEDEAYSCDFHNLVSCTCGECDDAL